MVEKLLSINLSGRYFWGRNRREFLLLLLSEEHLRLTLNIGSVEYLNGKGVELKATIIKYT